MPNQQEKKSQQALVAMAKEGKTVVTNGREFFWVTDNSTGYQGSMSLDDPYADEMRRRREEKEKQQLQLKKTS